MPQTVPIAYNSLYEYVFYSETAGLTQNEKKILLSGGGVVWDAAGWEL